MNTTKVQQQVATYARVLVPEHVLLCSPKVSSSESVDEQANNGGRAKLLLIMSRTAVLR